MATVATLQNRAARLLGKLASGESLGTNEASEALVALNAMIDSWRNELGLTYALQEETLTLAASTASYTIGSGGTLNTVRPVAIEAAWIVNSNVSYPVKVMDEDEYDAIPDKTSTATWPEKVLYRPTMSTGLLIVWPVPNAAGSMRLVTRVTISAYTATSDAITLPPGWEEALATNLAIALAPEYEVTPSASVMRMASNSLKRLRRINTKPVKAYTELVQLVGRTAGNILSDQ